MIDSKINEVQEQMKLANGWEIFRRYLVMNAFDGLLSVLGVVIGAYFLGTQDPQQVIIPALGVAVAIGISGSWIAYLTEAAENIKDQKQLEGQILKKLDNTRIAQATQTASVINSAINGLSPFFFGSITLIPFLFAGVISMEIAYMLSIGLNAVIIFVLGMFLGRIAKTNMVVMGIKTLTAGIVVAIILFLLG